MRTTGRILKLAALLGLAGAGASWWRFRRELAEAGARLEAGSRLIWTAAGPTEFIREGKGEPALVIHGAGGGYDQGLMIGHDTLGSGFDLIAPSRFGYLRTPLPGDLSPAAQADALALLLDALEVDEAVVV